MFEHYDEYIFLESLKNNNISFLYSSSFDSSFQFNNGDEIVLEFRIKAPREEGVWGHFEHGIVFLVENVYTVEEFKEKLSYRWELFGLSFLSLIFGLVIMHVTVSKRAGDLFPKRVTGHCKFCGAKMTYVYYHNKWYCYFCQKYLSN
jgi:hypothetical protein